MKFVWNKCVFYAFSNCDMYSCLGHLKLVIKIEIIHASWREFCAFVILVCQQMLDFIFIMRLSLIVGSFEGSHVSIPHHSLYIIWTVVCYVKPKAFYCSKNQSSHMLTKQRKTIHFLHLKTSSMSKERKKYLCIDYFDFFFSEK